MQPRQLGLRIVGQQPHRTPSVAVQHHRADGDAGDQRRAGEHPRHRGGDALLRAIGGAGRRQHLGQQHRHGLQLVDLFLGVAAGIAVLHHDHAQRPPGAPHRHGEHGGERFLAGLRAVGEGGMVLRIRQVHHLAGGGAQPDDALADAEPGAADGLRVEALGRDQLQDLAGARGVDRADLAHQLGRHQVDEFLQWRGAMRHRLAQSGQQPAGGGHRGPAGPVARDQCRDGLPDQFRDDLRRGLLGRHHADRLSGHHGPGLDIAVDHRAPQRPGPEVLDGELRRFLGQLACLEPVARLRLEAQEALDALVDQSAHRDHREPLIQLHRRHCVARRGADEGPLEVRMGDQLGGGGEPGAQLRARCAHLQQRQNRLAVSQSAGDEHRHVADMRQDLLRQHHQRHRTDMSAGLRALDHQRVRPGADQSLRQHQRRCERDQLRPAVLHRPHRAAGRNAAGQHDVADPRLQADPDQRRRAADAW